MRWRNSNYTLREMTRLTGKRERVKKRESLGKNVGKGRKDREKKKQMMVMKEARSPKRNNRKRRCGGGGGACRLRKTPALLGRAQSLSSSPHFLSAPDSGGLVQTCEKRERETHLLRARASGRLKEVGGASGGLAKSSQGVFANTVVAFHRCGEQNSSISSLLVYCQPAR